MSDRIQTQLSNELLQLLQKEQFVIVSSLDYETGAPYINAISWAFATHPDQIRLAVSKQSKMVTNIEHNPFISIILIGAGSCFAISGEAQIFEKSLSNVPIQLARIDVAVREVRNVMFYGARICTDPEFEKTYDEEAAAKLDQKVMAALQQ